MVAMGGIEPPPPAFLGLRSPKINYTEYSVESSGRPPSRLPSASSTRLHFGQMPPLPRSRFRAHSIAPRYAQIPQAVHQQIVLLHYLSVFVAAVQPVLLEEVLQRPEHFQIGRAHV